MKVVFRADGRTAANGTPLICHNPRLQDPLDGYTQALGAISSKRKKTLEDHQDMAQIEFLGGLYTDPVIEADFAKRNGKRPSVVIGIPAHNVLRALQDGAVRIRRGRDVLRGVRLRQLFCPLRYNGPADPLALYRDGRFTLRKDVGVGGKRVTRTRPIFMDWQLEVQAEMDGEIWNLADLKQAWDLAGRYCGLGDMRPIHGLFTGTLEGER